jgi:hypothetical protein
MAEWLTAIGTLLVAIAAIYGDRIRGFLFSPDLRVSLYDPRGEFSPQRFKTVENGVPVESIRKTRWYHVQISNDKRFAVAHEVQVLIATLEKSGPNGLPMPTYAAGQLPLRWQHQEVYPAATRTIGRPERADPLYVTETKELALTPLFFPSSLQVTYRGRTTLWITIFAGSIETDSKPLRLQVAWDGEWDPGEAEMAQHLIITEEPTARR